jgi:Ca2+-binding RTX toxin-like protein
MALVEGTNGNDTLNKFDGVTDFTDNIYGEEGNDTIYGLGGGDWIVGGAGADTIDGGAGDDWSSYVDSNVGVTVSLLTGTGSGGTAEGDTLIDIEQLWGSIHDDILVGDGEANWLWGDQGHDRLKGGGGADTLTGAEGNDMLKGGGGADVLQGDIGSDTAAYNESSVGVTVSLGGTTGTVGFGYNGEAEGDDLYDIENLIGSNHADVLAGNNAVNILRGLDGNDTMKGYGSSDSLWGGDGDDRLFGGESGDALRGENGNDILDGGAFYDTMVGGYGNDTYYVDNAGDFVIESGGQGIDEVRASASWTITGSADVEVLRTTNDAGTAAIDLTGNVAGNVVRGNNGANVINGGDGNDELTGLGGQDRFLFNTALDAAFNVDAITDFNVADDTIALDDAIFAALTAGNLAADQFAIGAAQDANDNIIYDDVTGALYYDADGVGAAAPIRFAQLGAGLALTHLDFLVV